MSQKFTDHIYEQEQQYQFAREMERREARADDHERWNGNGGRDVTMGEVRDAVDTISRYLWNRRTDPDNPDRDRIRLIHDKFIEVRDSLGL